MKGVELTADTLLCLLAHVLQVISGSLIGNKNFPNIINLSLTYVVVSSLKGDIWMIKVWIKLHSLTLTFYLGT